MSTSEPWTSFLITRPVTGGAVASSQFGFCGSGLLMSRHLDHLLFGHALTRRSGGFGHGIVFQHAELLTSGGSGHLPLHAGQPGGAADVGQIDLQAGFLTSNVNSSHGISASGTAASFGGSGISTFDRSSAIGPVDSLKS